MRLIEFTNAFKRDFKGEAKGLYGNVLLTDFPHIVQALALDQPLPPAKRDHALSGEWSDHRDCHIKPDLVLIYRKPDDARLQLVRLGSHSELGL